MSLELLDALGIGLAAAGAGSVFDRVRALFRKKPTRKEIRLKVLKEIHAMGPFQEDINGGNDPWELDTEEMLELQLLLDEELVQQIRRGQKEGMYCLTPAGKVTLSLEIGEL